MAIVFAVLVLTSFIGIQGWSYRQARTEQIEHARIATYNMTHALAQHTHDTLRAADLVLVGLVERLETEGMNANTLTRVHALLQMTVAKVPALDSVSVYDSQGNGVITSTSPIRGSFEIADRDYFIYHRGHEDREVHIDVPVKSRTSGRWILPVSRRINLPDGSFAGVTVATIDLAYFEAFHNSFHIGRHGSIELIEDNGSIVVTRPFDTDLIGKRLALNTELQTYRANGKEGSAVLTARIDGIERIYSYKHLMQYPLLVSSALSTHDVMTNWRRDLMRTLVAEALLLAILGVMGYRLIQLIGEREQDRLALQITKTSLERMNLSLERLTLQDSLTGLGNRRLFDMSLREEFDRARRAGTSLALLMIDVDYFKRYNDLYGHPAGDDCLRQLGQTLMEAGCRPGDVAVRYGGEELAVLLPGTGREGAVAAGERVRLAILARAITHAGNPGAVITVSVGVAACTPDHDASSCRELVQRADRALYAAKADGRNRVCDAGLEQAQQGEKQHPSATLEKNRP